MALGVPLPRRHVVARPERLGVVDGAPQLGEEGIDISGDRLVGPFVSWAGLTIEVRSLGAAGHQRGGPVAG